MHFIMTFKRFEVTDDFSLGWKGLVDLLLDPRGLLVRASDWDVLLKKQMKLYE